MTKYRPMVHIPIDKDIPIPDLNPNRGGQDRERPVYNKYPFPDMKVGDSFLCTNRMASQVMTSAHQWARRHPSLKRQFISRTLPEGVRIWRIK